MLTMKNMYLISAIVDKMDLQIDVEKGVSQEKLGADLLMQIIKKAHKAEKEITKLVSEYKGITIEEAENADLIATIKALVADEGIADFFKSAVK